MFSKVINKITDKIRRNPKKTALATLIVALAIARIWYEILIVGRLNRSAAFYTGLPVLVALVLTLRPNKPSSKAMPFIGMTLILLMGMIVLGEGAVCILMASPIFYLRFQGQIKKDLNTML